MWRVTGAHVRGTSHAKFDLPCQDYSGYARAQVGDTPVVVIAIADGAGSARLSHLGARSAVENLLIQVPRCLGGTPTFGDSLAETWFDSVRATHTVLASDQGCEVKDLACTILVAVLTDFDCFFAQVGDGAWIVKKDGRYVAATWPDNGEYANETTFVTSSTWHDALVTRYLVGGITAVAGFTDGLQRLALQITSRSVHAPFFDPLFDVLRTTGDESSLIAPLIDFLSSERVSERTDDDKTLVLASRVAPLLLTC